MSSKYSIFISWAAWVEAIELHPSFVLNNPQHLVRFRNGSFKVKDVISQGPAAAANQATHQIK